MMRVGLSLSCMLSYLEFTRWNVVGIEFETLDFTVSSFQNDMFPLFIDKMEYVAQFAKPSMAY